MKRLNNLRILIVIVILTYNAKKNSAARSRIMNGRMARPRKGFFVHTVFLIYFLGKSKSKKFQQSVSASVISRLPIFFMTKQSALPIVKVSQQVILFFSNFDIVANSISCCNSIDARIFFSSKTVLQIQVALHIWWSFLPPLQLQ